MVCAPKVKQQSRFARMYDLLIVPLAVVTPQFYCGSVMDSENCVREWGLWLTIIKTKNPSADLANLYGVGSMELFGRSETLQIRNLTGQETQTDDATTMTGSRSDFKGTAKQLQPNRH
jgi:hypothetical protein